MRAFAKQHRIPVWWDDKELAGSSDRTKKISANTIAEVFFFPRVRKSVVLNS